MTPELVVLGLAGLLQAGQIALYAVLATRDLGIGYATSPRDRVPAVPLSPAAGRAQRAMNNHFEGLILFTIAVVLVTAGGQSTTFTTACAWLYLAARLAYVPAYIGGWSPWRSLIWGMGLAATLAMILAALVP